MVRDLVLYVIVILLIVLTFQPSITFERPNLISQLIRQTITRVFMEWPEFCFYILVSVIEQG